MSNTPSQKPQQEGALGLFLHALYVLDTIGDTVERFRRWAEEGNTGVVIDKKLREEEQMLGRNKKES